MRPPVPRIMRPPVPQLVDELATFADLGTEPPEPQDLGDSFSMRIFREGEELELEFYEDRTGKVSERSLDGGRSRTHASYRALIASERFGNLRKWTHNQTQSLRRITTYDPITVKGILKVGEESMNVRELDDFLVSQSLPQQTVQIMLIDGPAGIGKTRFIESLATARAENFLSNRRPLILHVQSRGRVLTFLQDLIAFSLQRLRLSVTFDQLPVLVRHGLVTLAIDGFDELGDPNGYDLAWSQVSELVDQVRGSGTLILAGRETFIGRERITKQVTSLQLDRDLINAFSLQPPHPETARTWLRRRGWSNENLNAVDELFEVGSYALRPFFLSQLADREVVSTIRNDPTGNPLSLLVSLMINREAEKFGDQVNNVMTETERRNYVRRQLREVARFMADEQTESIDERMLRWLVDVVTDRESPEVMNQEILALLKNRVAVMAFLERDDAPNYRRFAHTQLLNHFLGEETIDAIVRGEIPKYVRRNILGADFLAALSDLVMYRSRSSHDQIHRFFDATAQRVNDYVHSDRGARNMGSWLVTVLPALYDQGDIILRELDIDEAFLRGTCPAAKVSEVVVNQLDAQGADLQGLKFLSASIGTLIVDDITRVSPSFPTPVRLQYEGLGPQNSRVLFDPDDIVSWLNRHGKDPSPPRDDADLIPNEFRNHKLIKLVGRACRNRSYWIAEEGNSQFEGFVRDPLWSDVYTLLKEHELVRVERRGSRPVAGRSNVFFHIKKPMDILGQSPDKDVRGFYGSLVHRMRELCE